MSQVLVDETSFSNSSVKETDSMIQESIIKNEDDDSWSYDHNVRTIENVDNTTAPSIDEITTQEINTREIANGTSKIHDQFNDDDDDDDDDADKIQVIIRDYEPEVSNFQAHREKSRGILSGASNVIQPKQTLTRVVDCDAQGVINGQPTFEFDIAKSFRDEDKPWKKAGADIADYFNYGFTEDTWIQYCDRQRRLRHDNSLPRHNNAQFGLMPHGHLPIAHPMNSQPIMMINKPMNMQMIQRPMNNARVPDGKINVIGTTDKTTRRLAYDPLNNFEQQSHFAGPPYIADQSSNGSTQTTTNNLSLVHVAPPGNAHHMPPMGMHRMPMMPLPHGMQFRPHFGHMHVHAGPQFLPQGSPLGMRSDRPTQQFFLSHHPGQPWEKTGAPLLHSFPPRPFVPQIATSETNLNDLTISSQNLTPENRSVHSPTPEENQTNTIDNEKPLKDNQFKERYSNDRDHHSSPLRRSSSKDHSSLSFHSRHRSHEDEYERPRNEKRSSRDREDKYEHSRKRSHRDNSSRHGRSDYESSRNRYSRTRTPTKSESSPSKSNVTLTQSSQRSNEEISNSTQSSSSSPRANHSYHDNSEHPSSRHSHHKKSSKRSRHDSEDERNSNYDRRRVKDKLNTNSKTSTNQTD